MLLSSISESMTEASINQNVIYIGMDVDNSRLHRPALNNEMVN
jgi:hypothetical protein